MSAMTSTMNFNRMMRRNSQENGYVSGSLRKKSHLWHRSSLNKSKGENTGGTFSKEWKPSCHSRLNSAMDYTDTDRTTVVLEKQDNGTFGFEIQTYGLQLKNSTMVEMCTFVSKVQEASVAKAAGLTVGDVIVVINEVSVEGFSHQHIVDLIRNSSNSLKMETVCGSVVKRIELEKKMNFLKKTLREKLVEWQTLTVREKCLTQGKLNESPPSLDSLGSLKSPTRLGNHRFSSDSSCFSVMTVDSDDDDMPSCVFEDLSPQSICSVASSPDNCFFTRDFPSERARTTLGRTRSISLAGSSGSLSPSWEGVSTKASLFGTLPRRSKQGSVRKHIFRFIPGLNHSSVEEEEIH